MKNEAGASVIYISVLPQAVLVLVIQGLAGEGLGCDLGVLTGQSYCNCHFIPVNVVCFFVKL